MTTGITIAVSATILTPSVPVPYRDAMIPVNAFMMNAMATRVYRQLKLGLIQDVATDMVMDPSTIEFRGLGEQVDESDRA